MDEGIRIKRREETILVLTQKMTDESNIGLKYLKDGDIVCAMEAYTRAASLSQRISQLKTELLQIRGCYRKERESELLSEIYKDLGIKGLEIKIIQ